MRAIIWLAQVFGTNAVSDLVLALEGDEEQAYATQLTPETASIAADEREHAEIWERLASGAKLGGKPVAKRSARDEAWHRGGRSGTLRAAVFGANDGLVSNLSLVMGVAGAAAGAAAGNHFIVLAGIAGLLAGAFSMAAGEYISMQSQREMFENQISMEREEMRVMPEVEREELSEIYRAKGLPKNEADAVADRLMSDPEKALNTMVKEELGLDPDELGSPWGAAGSSFVSFGIGAVIPLLPFLLATGLTALVGALALSFAALFALGAAVSLLTGRGMMFSGTAPGRHRRARGRDHVRRGDDHRRQRRLTRGESGESAAARLAKAGLSASPWSNGPGDTYAAHRHGYDKVLVATSGSITFHLTELGRDVELTEGQRLDLPAGTEHAATVGPRGVTCLEAHLDAGSLGPEPVARTDDW